MYWVGLKLNWNWERGGYCELVGNYGGDEILIIWRWCLYLMKFVIWLCIDWVWLLSLSVFRFLIFVVVELNCGVDIFDGKCWCGGIDVWGYD